MEKEREDSPAQHVGRAIPSQQGVFGVLRACEEQTAEFPWSSLIEAVATQLNILDFEAVDAVPPAVFRGALYMFPMVQRFKAEHEVVIQLEGEGLCPLVVWAHRILGMTVLVRQPQDAMYDHENVVETEFGRGTPHIIIECNLAKDSSLGASITLLVRTSKEVLFTFSPDPDEAAIDAYSKTRAKGYGKRHLEIIWSSYVGGFGDRVHGKEAVIQELQLVVAGLGFHVAKHLYMTMKSAPVDEGPANNRTEFGFAPDFQATDEPMIPGTETSDIQGIGDRCATDPQRLLEAARLLFNDKNINADKVEAMSIMFAGSSIYDLGPPKALRIVSDKYGYDLDQWEGNMLSTIRNLALVLLAFAHVTDLDAAADVLLNDDIDLVGGHSISCQLRSWDGKAVLTATDIAWFEVLAQLMIGHITEVNDEQLERTSLVSDRGWSLFTNTYGIADPSLIGEHPPGLFRKYPTKHLSSWQILDLSA